MKDNNAGFSIYELVIVIAVIAVLAAMATPSMFSWRERAKFNGAFENLRGDLRWARSRAIREHDLVAVVFSSQQYIIFLDNGAGAHRDNYIKDDDETLLRTRQLPAGVNIDIGATTIPGAQTQFDGRGRCLDIGNVVLQGLSGQQKQININPLGLVREQ